MTTSPAGASTSPAGNLPSRFQIIIRPYDHPDARRLTTALFAEQVNRYGYADPVEADAGVYAPPGGLFLVGYVDAAPVACGGFRRYRPATGTVEIKKMYTLPVVRGQGLGRTIICQLERRAAASGARRAILETGVHNTGALALYTSVGYQPTVRYVHGRDPEINRAFTKDL